MKLKSNKGNLKLRQRVTTMYFYLLFLYRTLSNYRRPRIPATPEASQMHCRPVWGMERLMRERVRGTTF